MESESFPNISGSAGQEEAVPMDNFSEIYGAPPL